MYVLFPRCGALATFGIEINRALFDVLMAGGARCGSAVSVAGKGTKAGEERNVGASELSHRGECGASSCPDHSGWLTVAQL